MNVKIVAVIAAALSASACTTDQSAQQLNTANANSQVYVGALTCNVSGAQGYVFGSSRDLSCVFINKEGAHQAYDGKIRRFGLDLGKTRPSHVVWKVYQIGGLVGRSPSTDPTVLVGNYGGEQASISAGASAGGNWLYGGQNNQIVLQGTHFNTAGNSGYNVAYGIAEIGLTLAR